MIISKINTEIETFCMDSDFRQSYPLIVFGGGARTQDPNIKSVVLYQLS